MGNYFNPEKGVWVWLSTLVDVVGLSILWIFLCLPVATIGPATAALYHAVVKCVRGREEGAFGDYVRSFLRNFKEGCLASLLCTLAAVLFFFGYQVMKANAGVSAAAGVMFAAYYAALFLPAGVLVWLFPLLGRFEFGLRGLFTTAFQLAVRHLPTTFVAVLLTAQTAQFCINRWWPVLFMPSLAVLLLSLFFERVFVKYAPELKKEEENGE